jgi:serine/threonine-protein kinase HipA
MRCPITYEYLEDSRTRYSKKGLRLLSPHLHNLKDFPYSQNEQREESRQMAGKLSIQGVQPKLSVRLNVREESFEPTLRGGTFILKMQAGWPNLPENEDVTMRMAASVGLEVPLHGLVYCKDNSFSYWIRRFDRPSMRVKLAIEDFAQLSGETRLTKYDSSMEKVVKIIETYTSFPLIEKEKLLVLTLFNFLIGNEDMHLKNFSIIRKGNQVLLSPVYDLLNTTLALGKSAREEMALPLRGKKNDLNFDDFISYFAKERLGLPKSRIEAILHKFTKSIPLWKELLYVCFLPGEDKEAYLKIIYERSERLGI